MSVCGVFMYTVCEAQVCVCQDSDVCGSPRTLAWRSSVFLRHTVGMTWFSVLQSTGAK